MSLKAKQRTLEQILRRFPSLAVAYSGGVDSSFLLYKAHSVLGERTIAVTARSAIHSERELDFSRRFTDEHRIRHRFIESNEMQKPEFLANSPERCYVCKRNTLSAILDVVQPLGIDAVAHGANVDDLRDYRPGMRAAEELGVLAPLVSAGLGKQDIRRLSKDANLSSWNRPAMACLASRIPYGTPITAALLQKIDAAEGAILEMGFSTCRVRVHGDIARIELPAGEIDRAGAEPLRSKIRTALAGMGFRYVTLDLEGYRMGSLNVFPS